MPRPSDLILRDGSAAEIVLPSTEAELLEAVRAVAGELGPLDARRSALLDLRRALFARLRALDPPTPHKVIAEAAGLPDPGAVSAVLDRYRKAAG